MGGDHNRSGWVDPATREYLDGFKKDLIEEVRRLNDDLAKNIKELIAALLDPAHETLRRHTGDISAIYDNGREYSEEIASAKTRLDQIEKVMEKHIESSDDNSKFKRTQAVAIVAAVFGGISIIVAAVLAFIGG